MLNLSVCVGSACHLKGSYNILNIFQQLIEEYRISDKVELKASFCMGHCSENVSVRMDGDKVYSVSSATAKSFFDKEVMSRLKD